MAELVANGADSVDFPTRGFARVIIVVGLKFVATSVGVDGDAVEFDGARTIVVEIFRRCQRPFVRPYRVIVAAVGLTCTCVEHKHLIDLTVAVPVVVLEIHFVVGHLTSLRHHFRRMQVFSLFRVGISAVIGPLVLQRVGTDHVECQIEKSFALSEEIVVDRADELTFAEAFFVGNSLVKREVVFGLKLVIVVVFDQNNQTFFLADVVAYLADFLNRHQLRIHFPCLPFHAVAIGGFAAFLCLFTEVFTRHRHKTVFRFAQSLTVFRQPIMTEFIAHELGYNRRSVAQFDVFKLFRSGWNGTDTQRDEQKC